MARNLLNRSYENVGLDQRIWLVQETGGFGAAATGGLFPTSSNGFEHVTAGLQFSIPRDESAARSGRSVAVRLSGKKDAKFSIESYIVPGTPDMSNNPTLPDAHPLLMSVFGAVDLTNPAQILYKLSPGLAPTFRVLEEGSHFSRLMLGCVTDSATFTLPGDGKAMLKFEGISQDVKAAGQSSLASAITAVNVLPVQIGQGQRFENLAYVDLFDVDGTTRIASGRQITAINGDSLTVNGAAITAPINAIVVGAAPDFAAQSSQNALLGLRGSFSSTGFGAIDGQLLSAEISIKNNYTSKSFIYGTDATQGFIADKRRAVGLKVTVLLTKDNFEFYMKNKQFIADNFTIVLAPQQIPAPINAAAGRTFTFNFPKVEFNVPNIEQPADSYIKLAIEGIALSTSLETPDTEFTLTIS